MTGYIINSTNKYYERTLPLLINSMIESNISVNDIYIYIGDCLSNTSGVYMGCKTFFTDHNSFDYTAFIEFCNNPILEYEQWFYLHDTCEVDLNFKNLVENNYDNNMDVMYFRNAFIGMCNIGMIKHEYLIKNKDYFNTLKNCNKTTAVKEEGHIFKIAKNKKCYPNEEIVSYEDNTYKSNIKRIVEYYKHIGVKKYKANWGQSNDWVIGV
jgi:hypothetical protein